MHYLTESLFPKGQSCREICMSHSKSRDNLEVPESGWCILAPAAVSFKVRTSLSNLLNFRQIFAIPWAHSIRFMTCQGKHTCVKEVALVYLLFLFLTAQRISAAGPMALAQSQFITQGNGSLPSSLRWGVPPLSPHLWDVQDGSTVVRGYFFFSGELAYSY